jgi:hypothetical protein
MRRINLVVLLMVVLIVAGLGITGVYRVQDASNRIKCQGNLIGIGIGLHSVLDATGHFPPATVSNPKLPPEKRLSWMTQIFVYMRSGYLSLLDKEKAWDDPENLPPRRQFWSETRHAMQTELYGDADVFFCPARSHTQAPDSASTTDYVGITGVGATAAQLPLSEPHAGFFGYDRQIGLKDIKDGTSNTIAVVEVLDGGFWTAGGHPTVRGLAADGRPYLGEGGQFSSLHGSPNLFSRLSGLNVLFADASVHYLTADLSPEVFEAMTTIAGRERVGALTD